MSGAISPAQRTRRWMGPWIAGVIVVVAQLWLVACAGTDIPFQDQWDAEGQELYPGWVDGTFRVAGLLRAHNEHRIAWTHGLNLALFSLDGQWDPLVQLAANAGLHALSAMGLVWMLGKNLQAVGRTLVTGGVILAFLPVAAWHNALWGFQSQVYFALLFSLAALTLLGPAGISPSRKFAGLAAGVAALLAMGAGAFVPAALLGLAALRTVEERKGVRFFFGEAWPALILFVLALAWKTDVPDHASLRAMSLSQYLTTLARVLAWPHGEQPWAAVVLNLPLALAAGTRLLRQRRAAAGEDFVLLLGGWALAGALAAAWARGGGDEFAVGVPSRYVDFFVLLPIANAWCVVVLAATAPSIRRKAAWCIAGGWTGFLLLGWLGLSAQALRGVILPRASDRDAPVRLIQAFQRSGDPAVFAGQPRLLVPHPDLKSVQRVLRDPRMAGRLPPSLQLERPMGPLSRAVRWLLRRQ